MILPLFQVFSHGYHRMLLARREGCHAAAEALTALRVWSHPNQRRLQDRGVRGSLLG
jgi:hypothetical protein